MIGADAFLADIKQRKGEEIGLTDWWSFDQDQVNAHGALTGDDGPIHSDPEWAARETAFGGSILQGSLMLSCFTKMAKSLAWPDGDVAYRMNYGFDRIRIVSPVRTGQKFRGRFRLSDARKKSDAALLLKLDAVIEAEGNDKPSVVAEWLAFMQFNS